MNIWWHRPLIPLVRVLSPPFFHYNLSEESLEGLVEQEQVSEMFLPNNHGLFRGTDTLSRDSDERIVIDLTQDSQNSFAGYQKNISTKTHSL